MMGPNRQSWIWGATTGTREDIRQDVDRLCCVMAAGGGYILGPAKPLQPSADHARGDASSLRTRRGYGTDVPFRPGQAEDRRVRPACVVVSTPIHSPMQ